MSFELAIFDIDGTLVDSGAVWAPAVQRAMREVCEEKGVALPIPSLRALQTMIGIPGYEALHPFIPEAERHLIPEISRRVGLYGAAAMKEGSGRLIEGARETLEELQARGCHTALASNCGNSYIREVRERLGLAPLVDLPICLETPGVQNKADMVALALETFRTRRALMVGDRYLDLEAAHRNGIPFLGFSAGFGEKAEWPEAEGSIHSYAEFFPALARREELIRSLAEELLARGGSREATVAGLPASGKSCFAEELEAAVRERGGALRAIEAGPSDRGAAIFLEVEEEIALRRFGGRLRGAAPETALEEFRRRFREAAEAAPARDGAKPLRVENSNLLAPVRIP